jgi:hypothetical protein
MPDIKVSANLDVASFRVVDNAVKSLITTVERLNRSMEGLSRSVQKIQTGGGPVGATAPVSKGPQAKSTGIIGAILGSEGSSVGRMVSETDRALDSVSRKVRSFTDRAISDVNRLNNSIGRIQAPDTGWSHRASVAVDESRFLLGRGPVNPIGPVAPSGAPAHNVPAAGGGRGGKGGGGLLGGLFGGGAAAGGGAGSVQGAIQSAVPSLQMLAGGDIAGFLGTTVGRLGAVGAGLYGGYKVGTTLTDTAQSEYENNLKFRLNFPVQQAQTKAQMVSPMQKIFQAGMSQSYSQLMAWNKVYESKEFMKTFRDVQMNKETVDAIQQQMSFSGLSKDIAARAKSWIGKTMEEVVEAPEFTSLRGEERKNAREIMKTQLMNQVPADMARRANEMFEANYAAMNPFERMMADEIGQNAMGRTKMMAAAGRRAGILKRKGLPDITAVEALKASAYKRGWDEGDVVAQHQAVLGIGAGYSGVTPHYNFMLSAGIAGLTNIGQLIKTGGTIGGSVGSAGNYIDNVVQGSIGGRRGLDVAVARDLYSATSHAALSTGFYGSSTLATMSQYGAGMVYGGGRDVAGQQNMMERYFRGGALEASFTSGARSPFDRALSNEAAIVAAGGFNAQSVALMRASKDPRFLASIAAGAEVPAWAEGLITKESAAKFLDRSRRGRFATVTDSRFENEPIRRSLLQDLRAMNNDSNNVMRARLESSGLKVGSKAWHNAARRLSDQLGSILEGDPMANAGMVEEAFLREMGIKGPHGLGGAWRAAPTGAEKKALGDKSDAERKKGEEGAKENVQQGVIGSQPVLASTYAARGVDSVRGAINDFGQAAQTLVNALNRIIEHTGSNTARALGPSGNAKGKATVTPIR